MSTQEEDEDSLTTPETLAAARQWLDGVGHLIGHSWEEDASTRTVHAYKEQFYSAVYPVPHANVSLCGQARRSPDDGLHARVLHSGRPEVKRCESCAEMDAANLAALLYSWEKRALRDTASVSLVQLKDTMLQRLSLERERLQAALTRASEVVAEVRRKWISEEGRAALALISSALDSGRAAKPARESMTEGSPGFLIDARNRRRDGFDWTPSADDSAFPTWVVDEVKRAHAGKYSAHPPYTDLGIDLLEALGLWPWTPPRGA